jgi:glycerophosphoryl diester phosphodiesterase
MDLRWLTARPIAHRGLHEAEAGIIENTASAFRSAIESGYGIETDLQISADSEAMVYHDDALGRLTEGGTAALATMSAAALRAVKFKAAADRIMTLPELLELVAGRVPLLLELKSRFDGDPRLPRRVVEVLKTYVGPVAAMSFDPALVEHMRAIAPDLVRGIVAERYYTDHEWNRLSGAEKLRLGFLLHAPRRTRPHFVAYAVDDLPALAPWLARTVFGLPLLTWTVRSDVDQAKARRYADQIIFEGLRP